MKQAHWDYVNSLFDKDDNDKGLWRYLKGMRKTTCGVSTLTLKGQAAVDLRDKAEMPKKQFSSVLCILIL